MTAENPRVRAITELVVKLTDEDQEAILKALKMQIILAQARRLDKSIVKNQVSMNEILSVVHQVRQIRHNGHVAP